VAARLGRTLLELGGNNAAIVCPTADLDLTVKGVTFSACGTTGQRCTSLRRLFVHEDIYERFMEKLFSYYKSLTIGDPSNASSQLGPLISEESFRSMQAIIDSLQERGIKVVGGSRLDIGDPKDFYVEPAIVEVDSIVDEMMNETFAPILYVKKFNKLTDAINMQNDVTQGLSSSIFTNDLRESELFLSSEGSDCGIANVNIGTSGAEIGGALAVKKIQVEEESLDQMLGKLI